MKKPWVRIIGALVLAVALLFGGAAAIQAAMGASSGYGPGYMMGGYGGMMNGYGYNSAQNPASTAPVTGDSVTIQNFAFQPANLQVKVGTTVTWTNQDTAPHTVTFRDSALTSSALLQKGQSFSYTFTKVGTFSYYCQVHPYMTAQVVVAA
ncbi:MAG TPA: cupredoxin family copper-binding protein [Ktedonobacterales bacterium]|jgi:amicyanin|nr:cupredoxin family copper-binding protein [Ktedonobacterales bacterium]